MSVTELADGKLRLDFPAAHVARLTIANERKRNALDHAILDALAETVPQLDARCLLLTGEGKVFSAGYDIGNLPRDEFADRAEALVAHPFHAAIEALDAYPFPSVAALNGHAIGGGLELALDVRIQRALGGQQLAQRALVAGERERRVARDPRRVGDAPRLHLVRRHDLVDHAPLQGGARLDVARGEAQLPRAGGADRVDELAQPGVAVDEAQARRRHPELGLLGGDAQIAGQRQLEAAADRVPVERGDRRVRERVERRDRLVERVRDERLRTVSELVAG